MDPEKRSRCLGGGVRDYGLSGVFRIFPQAVDGSANAVLVSSCIFCHAWIFYGIVDRRNCEFRDPSCRLRLSLFPGTLAAQLRD